MKSKLWALGAAAAAALSQPGQAALFVSADVNILLQPAAANQAFRQNIVEGSSVLAQQTSLSSSIVNDIAAFYTGAGYTAAQLASGTAITAASLAGYDLFIGVLPDDSYSAAEAAALAGFLAGGGNVFLSGDHSGHAARNALLNALLVQLGSGMTIIDDGLDSGAHTANILTANVYTAGTTGIEYGATSRVTGGTALFGTQFTSTPFVTFEATAVPEPAAWALMIVGFGAIGASLRSAGRKSRALPAA